MKPAVIHVSPTGSDAASGAKARGTGATGPVATPARALELARQTGARRILMHPGVYEDTALALTPADSGLVLEAAKEGTVALVGGRTLHGWKADGEGNLLCEAPGVREGTWDFRSLIVNGRFAERARYPEEGVLEHASVFNSNWMSSTAGGWDRKPTEEELTTMKYRGDDLGAWLSVRNAEVQIFHQWDDSLVGLAAHDASTKTLTFSSPAGHPAGAFGSWSAKARTYIVWNIREGLTRPGQWYLDRERGCVVYRPRRGEKAATLHAIAPSAHSIISVVAEQAPIENLSLIHISQGIVR